MSDQKSKDIYGLEQNENSPPSKPKGKNHLLVIAINQYDKTKGIPPLSNCVKDAEDFIRILTTRYQYREDQVVRFFDEQATIANIYGGLNKMIKEVKDQDNLIIYFSGHGYYDKSDNTGHLVPVDGIEKATHTYISNANLLNKIRAIQSFHTFLIVDSCFSGSLFATKDIESVSFEDKVNNYPSRWGLAAGMIERVTDGLHGENSPFAQALISFLKNNTQEKRAVRELISYVEKTTGNNADQTPIGGRLFKVNDMNGQFVFELEKDEHKDWKQTKTIGTIVSYERFLTRNPNGMYSSKAQQAISSLKAEAAWLKIQHMADDKENDIRQKILSIHNYLRNFPEAKYIPLAEELGEHLEYKESFLDIQDNLFALKRFARKNTPFKIAAQERIAEIEAAYEKEKQEKDKQAEIARKSAEEKQKKELLKKKTELERQKTEKRIAAARRKETTDNTRKPTSGLRKEKFIYNTQTLRYEKVKQPIKGKVYKVLGGLIVLMVIVAIAWSINHVINNGQAENQPTGFGTFIDTRDNQTYKWVQLKDGKKWMAENLNYETSDSWCYDNDDDNCIKYGRLYTWEAAKKACPNGWRLPDDEEWKALANTYGGYFDFYSSSDIGDPKATYKTLTDSRDGFSANLGGAGDSNSFDLLNDYGFYWSSTEESNAYAWFYSFFKSMSQFSRGRTYKTSQYSCRCILEEVPPSHTSNSDEFEKAKKSYTFYLSKGNEELRKASPDFKTAKQHFENAIVVKRRFDIDTQAATDGINKCNAEIAKQAEDTAWQKVKSENNITAYNGYIKSYPKGRYLSEARKRIDKLNEAERQRKEQEHAAANYGTFTHGGQTYQWKKMKDGKKWMTENLNYEVTDSWCYDNKESNCKKYGRLYSWEAAKKACPAGWDLPSDEEWKALAIAYGGYYDHGSNKEIGNPKAAYLALIDGSSEFSAPFGGFHDPNGSSSSLGQLIYFWNNTEENSHQAWYFFFNKSLNSLRRNKNNKSLGFSCRCIHD